MLTAIENPWAAEVRQLLHADTPEQVAERVIDAFAYSRELKLLAVTLRLGASKRETEAGILPILRPVPVKCLECEDRGRIVIGGNVGWCPCCYLGQSLREKQSYDRAHGLLKHLMDGYTGKSYK